MGKLRLGRGRDCSWALVTRRDTPGVAEAGSESRAGLPLSPPRPGSEVQPAAPRPSSCCSLAGVGVSPGAISGSALECSPGKVILQWVGANYRPACSSFQVPQPPREAEGL